MRKLMIGVILVILALVLAGCSLLGSRVAMLNRSSEPAMADARTEQIIAALQNEDAAALKALFSEKALAEAEDFDEDVERLFEFIEKEIETGERYGYASSATTNYGEKSLMLRFPIRINSENDGYGFFVIDYCTDTIDPENEGLYMLEVFQLEERTTIGPWQDRMRPGIYIH